MDFIRIHAALPIVIGFAFPTLAIGQELERTFETAECRYKLPSKDWSWHDDKATGQVMFLASSKSGFVVTLSCMPMSRPARLDQAFVDSFEKTFYAKANLTKRGGQFVDFLGRPCFQAEGTLPDGRTVVNRLLLGPKFSYNLAVIGGKEPVENAPEFATIVNGLTLTGADAPEEQADHLSRQAGRVVVYCLGGIVIVLVVRAIFPKSKPSRKEET